MPTIREIRGDFYVFTGKASDLNRQLAFAGIAVIWLFRSDVGGKQAIPEPLVLPAFMLVLSLALDMAQYVVASLIWRVYYRRMENAGFEDDDELGRHSVFWELPIWLLFIGKIACIIVAYGFILKHLAKLIPVRGLK